MASSTTTSSRLLLWIVLTAVITLAISNVFHGTMGMVHGGPPCGRSDAPLLHHAPSTSSLYSIHPMARMIHRHQQDVIVAMISFGNATRTNMVDRLVFSLKTQGEWYGRIVLLTDNADQYRRLPPDVTVLPAKESDLHPINPMTGKPIPFREVMRCKRFKTLVLDYVAQAINTPYTHVIYMDIDMVVTRPISLFWQDYVERMAKRTADENADSTVSSIQKKPSYMSMFSDCPTCAKRITNGGFIVLHKEHSKGCLQDWKAEFDDRGQGRLDQGLLRTVKESGQCRIHVLPEAHRLYPSWRDMRTHQSATFVHNTNTYGMLKIPAKVQRDYYRDLLNTTLFDDMMSF